MIIPCIDLQNRQVVQLVQGQELALVGDSPEEMLRKFADFPEIQVIDLDAAIGRGANDDLVEFLCARARCRVGGGVLAGGAEQQLARAVIGAVGARRRGTDRQQSCDAEQGSGRRAGTRHSSHAVSPRRRGSTRSHDDKRAV